MAIDLTKTVVMTAVERKMIFFTKMTKKSDTYTIGIFFPFRLKRETNYYNVLKSVLRVFTVILLIEYSIMNNFVDGHLGEKCNSILKTCLPLSPNIYCDANFRCRCKSDLPGKEKEYSILFLSSTYSLAFSLLSQ